jgi:protoporphyrinogen/coproporphyrinogen III oxidase
MSTIFIAGAGPSGLAAGYRLKQAGHDVIVLEASDRVGGQIWTQRHGDFLMEAGSTVMPAAYDSVMGFVKDMALQDDLVPAGHVIGYLRDGKLHHLRSDRLAIDALRTPLLSWKSKLRMLKVMNDSRKIGPKLRYDDLSAAADFDIETPEQYALRRGLGQELYDFVVDTTTRGTLTTPSEKVSVVEFFFEWNKVLGTKLYAFESGYGTLCERLAAQLDVRLGCRVLEVIEDSGGVSVTWQTADRQQHTERADGCIITAPGNTVPAIMPQLDPDCVEFLDQLRYSTSVNINLALNRRPDTDAAFIVIPQGSDDTLVALSLEHNKCPGRAPTGKGLVGASTTNAASEQFWDKTDEEVVAALLPRVEQILPGTTATVAMAKVFRWHPVIVYSHPGLYKKLGRFIEKMPRKRIHLAGSYFSSGNVNTATVAGERAARELGAVLARTTTRSTVGT